MSMVGLEVFRKSHRRLYDKYMGSFAWLRKKEIALKNACGKCQRCGEKGNKENKLSVHHLTYKRFTREKAEDLEVLCNICHIVADYEREEIVKHENQTKLYNAQLNGWASKVYGTDWSDYQDTDEIEAEFQEWLEQREE